ncbi:MAG: recombinase family protein [Lachnospiraceae bacterium]|nr:recombinase family protein [Lachnospiraceae bacterium]
MMPLRERAVTYNRCSTEEEAQKNALEMQVQESVECVEAQGWDLADQYIESKSGTTTKGRKEYLRLFEDLETDKFDIIVIKSQDRLMRNTADWYGFLNRMLENNKRLYMYIEHKFYTPDDALITGIKAILAEDYSRELSKKLNLAHRRRQTKGTAVILPQNAYGFIVERGKPVRLEAAEAAVKRRMYEYAADGLGSRRIANALFEQGITNQRGKRFEDAAIRRIIRNPINMGTVVMNRVHYDFTTKKTIRNPEHEWIVHKNMVPATVSEELWTRANHAMDLRAKKETKNTSDQKGPVKKEHGYSFSGILFCGLCGSPYYKRIRHDVRGNDVVEWSCKRYVAYGRSGSEEGCDNVHLNEQKLFQVVKGACSRYFQEEAVQDKDIAEQAIQILRLVLQKADHSSPRKAILKEEQKLWKQKDILIEKLLSGVVSNGDYQRMSEKLDGQLALLRQKKAAMKQQDAQEPQGEQIGDQEQRIEQIRDRLDKGGVREAAALGMLRNMEKIAVYPGYLEIQFDAFNLHRIRADYHFPTYTQSGKAAVNEKICETLQASPELSAKRLAEELGLTIYYTRRRLQDLKDQGRIRYQARGAHSYWEVTESG